MYENEIWKSVAGYEGLYEVSNMGRVRSLHKCEPHVLKPKFSGGYLQVSLSRNNKQKTLLVHRLVALAFVPNPFNKPEVDHVNNIKSDNRVENLRWATRAENQRYAVKGGAQKSGEDRHNASLNNEQVEEIRNNPGNLSIKQLTEKYSVSKQTISKIQRGETYKTAGGFVREKIDRRTPDRIREQVRVQHGNGVSIRALAKEHGLGITTIRSIIKEA